MRRPAQFFSVEEVSRLMGMPEALIIRHLMAPGRLIFSRASEENGVWSIPEKDLRSAMDRRVEQLYKVADAAELLSLSYWTLHRAVKAGTVDSVTVLGEVRIRESTLAKLMDGGPVSFSRKRGAA